MIASEPMKSATIWCTLRTLSAFGESAVGIELMMRAVTGMAEMEIPIYDQEEIYTGCTVQVLTNSVTGAVSIGWWQEETEESS